MCDIVPASEDISCSIRPLSVSGLSLCCVLDLRFCSLIMNMLLQGTFRTGQGWLRHQNDRSVGGLVIIVSNCHTDSSGASCKAQKLS